MDELQAAFLRVRLSLLTEWNARRAKIAASYLERLTRWPDLVLPTVPAGMTHAWHLFVVRTPRRDALRNHLEAAGVETQIHYPTPPHLSPAYASFGWSRGRFPLAEQLANEVLSLPIGPHLSADQVDYTCDCVRSFFQKACASLDISPPSPPPPARATCGGSSPSAPSSCATAAASWASSGPS
jgi:dTDP-3-amino-3,4,6-trideoxy-alpha-D-glucose transaminase